MVAYRSHTIGQYRLRIVVLLPLAYGILNNSILGSKSSHTCEVSKPGSVDLKTAKNGLAESVNNSGAG